MWPQLSLQLMMGVGTPMATQVKVTVWPREAWMDSWGGVTTWGGTGETGDRSEGCEGQREEEWGRRAGPWELTHPRVQGPWLASPNPGPHSLQPNSSLRSGQSLSSSQWKLDGIHVFVETQRNCVGPHTSSGRLAARGQSQAVWAACTALREDHPHSHLHPTVNPAYVPLVSPGSLSSPA